MNDWDADVLGNLAAPARAAFATGPFGSSVSARNFRESGVPMLRGSNLSEDIGIRLDESDMVFLDEGLANKFTRSTVGLGDLIFTCWGTVGQVGIIDSRNRYERYIISNKQMKMTPDPKRVNSMFLYYYLSQPSMVDLVKGQAIGSSVPGFNLGQLRGLPVRIPDLAYQQAIAEVLGALDDKIAANTGVITTTDSLLEARLAEALAVEDFEIVPLGSIAKINGRVVKPIAGGHLRYIDIASVGVGRYEFPGLQRWADAPSRARRGVRKGDTLWSTVRPNRRSHALNLSTDPSLVGSTGLAVISPQRTRFAYLYEVTKLPEFTAFLESAAEGSAYPAVRADRFEDAPVPMLPDVAIDAFEDVAAPLRHLSHALSGENLSLAQLRDALLPHLMSGKLRVRDAEKVVEAVV